MRFLAAATRMNRPPEECADGALTMLGHFNQGPVDPPDPQSLAQDAFDLAEAISNLRAALVADPAHFASLPEATWGVRRAAKLFRVSYSMLLPARVVSRSFAALEALLAVKTKPKGKEEWTAWRCLMADAHDFQNALHNDAIGLERDLPIGAETAGGTPARVTVWHAEGVIVFPVLRAREWAAFDVIFGDGASDR
jgi:hypothetical protein